MHDLWLFIAFLLVGEGMMFGTTGAVNSSIMSTVDPGMRAIAIAVNVFVIHLLGDMPSPYLVGLAVDSISTRTVYVCCRYVGHI